jgi:hypothetical protein
MKNFFVRIKKLSEKSKRNLESSGGQIKMSQNKRWGCFTAKVGKLLQKITDLPLCLDGNWCCRTVWNLISCRTLLQVGYRRRDGG